jgi:hypothetical protein
MKFCSETQTNNQTKGQSMSALPFISHHLFAAAARKDGTPERPARNSEQFSQAAVVPLELLDWTKPLPEGLAKPMRGRPSGTKT